MITRLAASFGASVPPSFSRQKERLFAGNFKERDDEANEKFEIACYLVDSPGKKFRRDFHVCVDQ